MKAKHIVLLIVAGLLTAGSAFSASTGGTISDLDALVGRWMDLRSAIADEKRQWQARQEQWQVEIQLLEEEKAKLQKEIDDFNQFASSVEKDRAAILARKETMETVLKDLEPILDRSEKRLRSGRQWIPGSLGQKFAKVFDELMNPRNSDTKKPLTERIQRVVALYTQIEILQAGLHSTREILETGQSQRRQVDILYIGLARGYAVSSDDQWAAVGVPHSEGWVWTERPEIAANVRLALQVLDRQKTAALVDLPISINEQSGTVKEGGSEQ
jgi:hypothetical protein